MGNPEKNLLECFRRLPEAERDTLVAFAEFLVERAGSEPVDKQPKPIPRPDTESVVGAIRRLSETYHMLDRSKMLHETSALMAQHVMQGREACKVIDELEVVFRRHHQQQFGDDTR
ncbi:Crp/Fnr family transcriptional regulator [Thiohalomonas denitrificans]|uniref:Crp/Fnr family transcriptional regulator n=1 Tax=Thiohalomonas denitrificans TaxID=415747 RepID=UPI0026EA2311|nr:Crp/Fnr family transcriptional regulator [Thiohalomonas denitrificans]